MNSRNRFALIIGGRGNWKAKIRVGYRKLVKRKTVISLTEK
jgi:hypothetical protein